LPRARGCHRLSLVIERRVLACGFLASSVRRGRCGSGDSCWRRVPGWTVEPGEPRAFCDEEMCPRIDFCECTDDFFEVDVAASGPVLEMGDDWVPGARITGNHLPERVELGDSRMVLWRGDDPAVLSLGRRSGRGAGASRAALRPRSR
jgi:hypothetical protein